MKNVIDKLKFNPLRGYVDSNAFPNPKDEDAIREQIQRLHNQTRDYINQLVDLIQSDKGASLIGAPDGLSIEEFVQKGALIDYSQLEFDVTEIVPDALIAFIGEDCVLAIEGLDAYFDGNVLALDNVYIEDGILLLGE